jgi:hypothetical protein
VSKYTTNKITILLAPLLLLLLLFLLLLFLLLLISLRDEIKKSVEKDKKLTMRELE